MLKFSRQQSSEFNRYRLILLAAALAVAGAGFIRFNTTNPTQAQTRAAPDSQRHGGPPPPQQCSTCPLPSPQTIYAPTIGIWGIAEGRIVFNSRTEVVTEVQTTFYTEDGIAVSGPMVKLQPAEIRFVEIASLIPAHERWRVRWGGMSLSYTGKAFDIWAQITLLGAVNRGSSDVTFSVLNGVGSDTQEAVWQLPRGGRAIIALGNSADSAIHTKLDYSGADSQELDIAPHGTEYVRLHPRGNKNNSQSESVRVVTVGPTGSLKAAGVVVAGDNRLASSVRFYDTRTAVQPNLFATNLRLKGYAPRIVLKNTSAGNVTAQPRFRPVEGDSGNPVELPLITLAPEETVELDLSPLMIAAAARADLDTVSVQILNSGAPGSLIGAISGINPQTGATYDVPLRDSGPYRMNTGSYPWRIDGDYNTTVSITNVGDMPSRYIAEIRYAGGKYIFGDRPLAVGETALFDLRKISEQHTPDVNGNVLPDNVKGGQFRWHSFPAPGTPHMIGRAAVSSRSEAVSASYSCVQNCGTNGPWFVIDGLTTVPIDGFQAMTSQIYWYWGSGGYSVYNTNMSGASMDNSSIASLNPVNTGWLDVNGLAVGESFWSWSYEFDHEWDDGYNCQQASETRNDSVPANVLPTITVGTISLSPNHVSSGQDATFSVTIAASSAVPNTDGATVEVGISNASGNFTLSFTPTSHPIQLTGGQSHTYNFTVHLAVAPTNVDRTCNLTAHVNGTAGLMVIGNDPPGPALTAQH